MDQSPHTNDPHTRTRRFLATLSLHRTLTATHSLTRRAHSPTSAEHNPDQHGLAQHTLGLPRPLLVLGLAIALIAATTTAWALGPWLPLWALILAALLATGAGFVTGTIAMTPFLVSTTWSGHGSPTGHHWVPPTALTFLACTCPLLSPLPPWWNTLGFWSLLGTAALLSAYLALPALGRDIELDQARNTWNPHQD